MPRSPRNHRWTLRGAVRLPGGAPRDVRPRGAEGTGKKGTGAGNTGAEGTDAQERRLTPAEALRLLREGNARRAGRGARGARRGGGGCSAARRPVAAVLACVDCPVPPETLFGQEPGALLVIRTAAHTLDATVEGSVEYGPVELGVPLVVVLGHERCGAVAAALESRTAGTRPPAHLAVAAARLAAACRDGSEAPGDAVENTVRAQQDRVVAHLRDDPVLLPLLRRGELEVVGAHCREETGNVEFPAGP
ncbi:carbonic anhydrase [Streptomyces sp. KL2]|uniref:carbonic anhydrase n=1 Tax=Streptomyces sp. KL2 TaxID=3050126 RepID=UPI0039789DC4